MISLETIWKNTEILRDWKIQKDIYKIIKVKIEKERGIKYIYKSLKDNDFFYNIIKQFIMRNGFL